MKRLRNIAACGVACLLIGLGFTKRAKKKALKGTSILSIYFHAPGRELFEFCIKWLIKNKFQVLSQEEVLSVALKDKPFPKGAVIITADDGWQTNEENIVAIANTYQIPVTIFISTDPVKSGSFWWSCIASAKKMNLTDHSIESLKKLPDKERKSIVQELQYKIPQNRAAMTLDQIQSIAKSNFITIGAHTVSHPILPTCENVDVYKELKDSKETIEKWLNKEVNSFAYPNGDYGAREITYLKELGYALAYTTKPEYLTEQNLSRRYELPRFCIYEDISKAEAICRMLGLWQKIFKV